MQIYKDSIFNSESDERFAELEVKYETTQKQWVTIARVTLSKGQFSIEHVIKPVEDTKEIYNLTTKEFYKVNLICLSPNHWGDNQQGNKHYFFMIENCKTEDKIRSFHIENLNSELYPARKTLERISASNLLETTFNQLSGLGFNSTIRDEVILKIKGEINKIIKIKF